MYEENGLGARLCPNCEQPVATDDRFCDVCNTALGKYFTSTKAKPERAKPILLPAHMPENKAPIERESKGDRPTESGSIAVDSTPETVKPSAVEPGEENDQAVLATTEVDGEQAGVMLERQEEVPVGDDSGVHDSIADQVCNDEQPPEETEHPPSSSLVALAEMAVPDSPSPANSDRHTPIVLADASVTPNETPIEKRAQTGDFFGATIATPEDVQLGIDRDVLETCQRLVRQGYHMYGLFGRPSTGKSSLIYALRHHFIKGDSGFGGYATEGQNWDHLAQDLEAQWQDRQVPTSDKLHPYLALHPRGGKHIALLDIAGERFEGIQSWTDEIFEFFGLYLAYCKGFFILVELDDLAGAVQVGHDASARIQSQMARIVRFLAVAGQLEKLSNVADVAAKRAAAEAAVSHTGKVKVKVPVALCLSKADTVAQMQFGPALGNVVPGSLAPQSDPWNVLQAVWPEHVATLLKMVPHLKVDWLSCLGTQFEAQRQFSGSIGLRSAFQHVVWKPPPKWSLSTDRYLRWQKWLRL